MPAERFYIAKPLKMGDTCTLTDAEFHHLTRVMRADIGCPVELINGKGVLAQAIVRAIEKKHADLKIEGIAITPPPMQDIILAQALPRGNRLDFIVEKCTELGMTQLWLFPGKHSERKELSENQTARIESLMIAAIKQSGVLWLPKLVWMPPLQQWKPEQELAAFFGDLSSEAPLFLNEWQQHAIEKKGVVFFVGPESGFTEQEEECLRKMGAKGVKLHNNVLRTDTAGIIATGLIHHCLISTASHSNI